MPRPTHTPAATLNFPFCSILEVDKDGRPDSARFYSSNLDEPVSPVSPAVSALRRDPLNEGNFQKWLRQLLDLHHEHLDAQLQQLREGQLGISNLLQGKAVRVARQTSPSNGNHADKTDDENGKMDLQLANGHDSIIGYDSAGTADLKLPDGAEDIEVEEVSSPFSPTQSQYGFPLREVWVRGAAKSKQSLRSSSVAGSDMDRSNSEMHSFMNDASRVQDDGMIRRGIGLWSKFIAYPASRPRITWELFGGLLILYDLYTIPLEVFRYPTSSFTIGMDWLTLIFWTVNVAATLTVGFVKSGVTIMLPRDILINYLKTWFVIDCLVLIPDWSFTIASLMASEGPTETSDGEFVKILRILRLARTARLLRLLKLKKVLERISDYLDSEFASIVTNIAKMIALLLALNHGIACVWFLIADTMRIEPGDNTWLEASGYADAPWEYQYVVAFHWSITQFTPASMNVQPQNIYERVYAIGIVVFALVGFSYVVGSITGSLAQLRSMSEQATKDFWMLRRFLKRNNVAMPLSVRIQRFVEHAHARKKEMMSIHEVRVLSLLSGGLMEELQCALNLPHMLVHPLFHHLKGYSASTTTAVAKGAVSRRLLARRDTLFMPSQNGTHLFFVASGRLQYGRNVAGPGGSREMMLEYVDSKEDWVSEPVMWTSNWVHVGELVAVTECDMLALMPEEFARIVNRIRPVANLVGRYAVKFMQWISSQDEAGELTDVIQGEDASDLVRSFIPLGD
eukprot:TRINITY_DN105585_c0_g1_i1.p1 TRINITY_DN105585_c0_g1~~TRINITY_DN105585_c0_g1_i1.p1  ORF type:complete len:771 (-),score=110.16 TRINITY_DN105585_c0_g1_i1:150-2366(-)